MIRINEIFGPTIQGEGVNTGKHCMFVRVSRCNLTCTWCDTPFTWAHTEAKAAKHQSGVIYERKFEEREMSADEVFRHLRMLHPDPTMVVISGGEPMLQQKELEPLVKLLKEADYSVDIETAGTIAPVVEMFTNGSVHYNVSPKLKHSGNIMRVAYNPVAIEALINQGADFKFVVKTIEDLDEVAEYQQRHQIPSRRIWIMPEGTNIETIKIHGLSIADNALRRSWNITLRNHVWLWGEERGR